MPAISVPMMVGATPTVLIVVAVAVVAVKVVCQAPDARSEAVSEDEHPEPDDAGRGRRRKKLWCGAGDAAGLAVAEVAGPLFRQPEAAEAETVASSWRRSKVVALRFGLLPLLLLLLLLCG